jgi:DNA-binding MarR family transcriptional regulator
VTVATSADAQTDSQRDVATLIGQILRLLSRLSGTLGPQSGELEKWLTANHQDRKIAVTLLNLTVIDSQVINAIGAIGPVNGITISRNFGIPKGSVSKSIVRLVSRKIVVKEHKPGNKKEYLLSLTESGKKLHLVHKAFDGAMERGFARFLQRYRNDELAFVVRLLEDVLVTSFSELGSSAQTRQPRKRPTPAPAQNKNRKHQQTK